MTGAGAAADLASQFLKAEGRPREARRSGAKGRRHELPWKIVPGRAWRGGASVVGFGPGLEQGLPEGGGHGEEGVADFWRASIEEGLADPLMQLVEGERIVLARGEDQEGILELLGVPVRPLACVLGDDHHGALALIVLVELDGGRKEVGVGISLLVVAGRVGVPMWPGTAWARTSIQSQVGR